MLCMQAIATLLLVGGVTIIPSSCIVPRFGFSSTGMSVLCVYMWCAMMALVFYYKACVTDPGKVPAHWGAESLAEEGNLLPPLDNGTSIVRRYCDVCNTMKPPRTHHCTVCKRCVLKMDHHCPWLNTCVGAHNYKFYLNFILFALLGMLQAIVHVLAYVLSGWEGVTEGQPSGLEAALLLVSVVLYVPLVVLLGCLLGHHVGLVRSNMTTIEHHGSFFAFPPLENPAASHKYNLGLRSNLRAALGSPVACWFCPVAVQGDGVNFPTASTTTTPGLSCCL